MKKDICNETSGNENALEQEKFIEIVCEKEKVLVNLNEIMCIERENRKVCVTTPGKKFRTYESLNSLMTRLPENFVRVHTGFIVNLKYVLSIHSNYLLTSTEKKISIGRSYKAKLVKNLHNSDPL